MATELQVKMPWEPRPAEPPLAYARFRLYLELGPSRSLAKAAEAGGLSLARLKQLSGRWQWPLRAVAWDEHQFRERCRHEAQAQAEAQARLLKESADWQRLAWGASLLITVSVLALNISTRILFKKESRG